MKATLLRWYMLTALGLSIFFLLATSVFEVIPLTSGNNDLIVSQQASFQLARLEFLIKDVYVLAYRGPAARARAVGDMQSQIPAFEQTQKGLLYGDASLGLPPNPSPGVKQAILSAQTDYDALVSAMKSLLAHADKPADLVQVSIVEQHELPYIRAMYPIIGLLMQEAQSRTIQLLLIKMGLIGLTIVLILLKYLLFSQRVIKQQIEEEKAKEQPP